MGVLIGLVTVVVCAVVGALVWRELSGARSALDERLTSTGAEVRRLADMTAWRDQGSADVRHELSTFRTALEELRIREEERRTREEESWSVLHRVASVLAGGQRAGRAGENVLRESLSHLPPSMVVTDFRVNGRVVEFGLVLPDGRRLPVDSKWPAERELEALAGEVDDVERERLVRLIEKTVAERAREVAGYRDPALTAPIAVAAVPDAAYALLRRAHADAYRQGVIVIPYSMALPVLLFLYSLVARFGSIGDIQACLTDLASALDYMEATLENRLAKASTMLVNGADELRGQVGKARATLARAREAEAPLGRAGEGDAYLGDATEASPSAISCEEEGDEGMPRLVRINP